MGRISSFITGAAVGCIAALLLAPRTGEESRAFVAEKANAVVGEAKDFAAGLPGSATSALSSLTKSATSLVKDAPAKVQGVAKGQPAAPKAAPADSDELREKIEAARKRIAAQVMENAEQAKAVEVKADGQAAAATA